MATDRYTSPLSRALRQQGNAVYFFTGQEVYHMEKAVDRTCREQRRSWDSILQTSRSQSLKSTCRVISIMMLQESEREGSTSRCDVTCICIWYTVSKGKGYHPSWCNIMLCR